MAHASKYFPVQGPWPSDLHVHAHDLHAYDLHVHAYDLHMYDLHVYDLYAYDLHVHAHAQACQGIEGTLLKRGPAPLLFMPGASLGGLPGFLSFAAAAPSHSACAALSLATDSACAFAASPCLLLISCPTTRLAEVCNPKMFVPLRGLEGRLRRLSRPVPIHA